MNIDKNKKNYESPCLTVVSFKAERGFAESTASASFDQLLFWEEIEDNRHMESYTVGNGWNEGSNHFWD